MSFFGKLFGSDSVIKRAADGIYNGVDKAVFTKEEQAEHFLKLLNAYEPFKLAQRFMALIFGIPYVLVWLTSATMFVIAAFMEPCAVDVVCQSVTVSSASKELASWNNETLGTPVALILAFYFGGGALEGVARQVAERKKL
ncbi:hypothetical protein [Sansalvadorimonas verongulae]|uniref:hypothetical protein n=1 Tax=Sansalvadorimonas verongulae TaxID=2172824 RepID=UPI0012BD3F52|nr:hypothetical protein [Sansalvadorimonas verongulae]MTI13799.1 hypothetical protein [Sansalvadorimonas verongulae]